MPNTAYEEEYRTVRKEAEVLFEEKKSRFFGRVAPATTEEAALAFLRRAKNDYPEATHHVYAYILRENQYTRYSDDGEPAGTAGIPVLDVLRKKGVTDVVAVVIRYFGGTLLGSGGLVRAYTQAVSLALEKAEIAVCMRLSVLHLSLSYADYQRILTAIEQAPVRTENSEFSDRVVLTLSLPAIVREEFCRSMQELCGGRIAIATLGEKYGFL